MTEFPGQVSFSDPKLLSEPFEFYAALRKTAPVCPATDPRGKTVYIVTSYAMIEEATRRKEDFSNLIGHLLIGDGSANAEAMAIMDVEPMAPGLLLVSDDPVHARCRALVHLAFSQGRVSKLAPTIERITDELIEAFLPKGECDFVNEFAVLLPTFVIADILGLPRSKFHLVRTWSDSVIRIVSQMGSHEEQIAAAHHVVEFRRFIRQAIAERRKEAADDLISNLVHARLDGMQPLNDDEAAALTFEIAVAGNETTRNTLMSGMTRLVRTPDQLQMLIDNPSLIPNAVEELLRYETPATALWRVAAHDTELGGVSIPKGAEILLRFDAGNRDPEMFPDPDRFDITRENARRHLAFGATGVHRCLGQMLARGELTIGLRKLLSSVKNIRVLEGSDTAYWPGLLHRGITSLRIGFDAA